MNHTEIFENILKKSLKQLQESSIQTLTDEQFGLSAEDLKDELDLTSSVREQAMLMRLRNRQALLIKKVEAALERIQTGSFGVCEDCEEPIEIKRLMARPMTTFCRRCKEAREHLEQSHIDGRRHKSLGQIHKRGWLATG